MPTAATAAATAPCLLHRRSQARPRASRRPRLLGPLLLPLLLLLVPTRSSPQGALASDLACPPDLPAGVSHTSFTDALRELDEYIRRTQ
ncbi:hypothetical protein HK405_002147, partial [Cladochytrium tenue]